MMMSKRKTRPRVDTFNKFYFGDDLKQINLFLTEEGLQLLQETIIMLLMILQVRDFQREFPVSLRV